MELLISGSITEDTSKGILKGLQKSDSAETITLNIDSPGGSVLHGYAIFNRLKQSGKKIIANVLGQAGSMASVLLMLGSKGERGVSEMSRIMIHNPMAAVKGNASDFERVAKDLKAFENELVSIYSDRTKLSKTKIREMMANETKLTAQEAVDMGFADKIINPIKAVALFENNDMSLFDKLKEVLSTTEGEKAVEEVKAEIEEKVKEEVSEKKDSDNPYELLTQDFVNITDYSEFKNEASGFMDAMIEYVKAAPTQDEIDKKIEEVTNKKILDFIGKIKSEGKVPNKTETEATYVKAQTGNNFWNEIEEGIKELNKKN